MSPITDKRSTQAMVLWLGWLFVAGCLVVAMWNGGLAMETMIVAMTVLEVFFDGDGVAFELDWITLAVHLVAFSMAVTVSYRLVKIWRATRQRCARCGRRESPDVSVAWWRRRATGRVAAKIAIAAALAYSSLKLAWALGSHIGVINIQAWPDVTIWSPGFMDTVIMSMVSIIICLVMAWKRTSAGRWLVLVPAFIGCLMLVPVSIIGMATNFFTSTADTAGVFAPWVGWFVYSVFVVWGACLSLLTAQYFLRTRPQCRDCGQSDRVLA